jgi:hypothetical protein
MFDLDPGNVNVPFDLCLPQARQGILWQGFTELKREIFGCWIQLAPEFI